MKYATKKTRASAFFRVKTQDLEGARYVIYHVLSLSWKNGLGIFDISVH